MICVARALDDTCALTIKLILAYKKLIISSLVRQI